jgi:RNA polymerase sigma factor (TIGR02999 family)
MASYQDTSRLLLGARDGDRAAFDLLYAKVYAELRDIAHHRLRRHQPGDTLNTTALVHEAYLRLVDHAGASVSDRAHFLALASRAMRFVLVDHARASRMQKRGGGREDVPLDRVQVATGEPVPDLIALDQALDRLHQVSDRQGRLVEYRFFGGLEYAEIAELMGLSVRTVKREWVKARTWLYTYMHATPSSSSAASSAPAP